MPKPVAAMKPTVKTVNDPSHNNNICASYRPDLCEPIIITLPNVTTARDLSPSRPTRKTAHRNVASNNLRRLQRKQAGVSVALHTLLVVPRLHDRAPRPARDSECHMSKQKKPPTTTAPTVIKCTL